MKMWSFSLICLIFRMSVLVNCEKQEDPLEGLREFGEISIPNQQIDPKTMKELHKTAKELLDAMPENVKKKKGKNIFENLKNAVEANRKGGAVKPGPLEALLVNPVFQQLVDSPQESIPSKPVLADMDEKAIESMLNEAFGGKNGQEDLTAKDLKLLKAGALDSVMNEVYKMELDAFFTPCQRDINRLIKSRGEMWAIRMLDSFGKPNSGILKGSVSWIGDYDECLTTVAPRTNKSKGFKGKFCWLLLDVKVMKKVYPITTGVCIPNSCTAQEIYDSYPFVKPEIDSNIVKLGLGIEDLSMTAVNCHVPDGPLSTGSVICIYIMLMVITLVILGTSIDYAFYYEKTNNSGNSSKPVMQIPYQLQDSESSAVAEKKIIQLNLNNSEIKPNLLIGFLLCFSFIRNNRSIMNQQSVENHLDFIHGLRFMASLWVIAGHLALNGMSVTDNPEDAVEETHHWYFLAITQGSYCVDMFFFMSGFLLTYHFLKNNTKIKGFKDWIWYYLHRYIRLTPIMGLMILISATVARRIGEGPNWPNMKLIAKECYKLWPWHFMYLNNFKKECVDCVSWTWYLANDFQFYAISPIFLIGLVRKPKLTVIIIIGLIIICSTITYIISYSNSFLLTTAYVAMYVADPERASKEMDEMTHLLYVKPYCRMAPYFIGMLLGYYYHHNSNKKVVISKGKQLLFWSLTVFIIAFCVFGIHGREISIALSAFYHSYSRAIWSMAMFWITFACLTGNGGFLNTFLSWNVWFPVSRLSYANYLLHPLVMYWYFYTMQAPYYLTKTSLTIIFFGITVISYIFAYFYSLLFEAPCMKLEKFARTGKV